MDSNVRAKFKTELVGLYDQLLAAAVDIVRRSGWRGRFDLNRASVAEDLLHEVVVRTYDGTRTWDPSKVDLRGYVVGAMKSIVNNSATSPENRTTSFDAPTSDGSSKTKWDAVQSTVASAEETLITNEASALESEAFAAAGDDEVLLRYLEAVMDGADTPAEIAADTGLTASEVYQAHRKLWRRIAAHRAKAVK